MSTSGLLLLDTSVVLHVARGRIAATAAVAGAVLLTTDKDFDPMHGRFLTRVYFDPAVA